MRRIVTAGGGRLVVFGEEEIGLDAFTAAVLRDASSTRHPLVQHARAVGAPCVLPSFLLEALLERDPKDLLAAALHFELNIGPKAVVLRQLRSQSYSLSSRFSGDALPPAFPSPHPQVDLHPNFPTSMTTHRCRGTVLVVVVATSSGTDGARRLS
eukprot:scaffold216813_cov31-Tisochrysis_lutea.AAC.2